MGCGYVRSRLGTGGLADLIIVDDDIGSLAELTPEVLPSDFAPMRQQLLRKGWPSRFPILLTRRSARENLENIGITIFVHHLRNKPGNPRRHGRGFDHFRKSSDRRDRAGRTHEIARVVDLQMFGGSDA